MFRWRCLPQMLASGLVMSRTIHGSDFPFPSNAFVFWHRLGWSELFRLITEKNLLERDFRLKRALGLPQTAFSLGAKFVSPAKSRGESDSGALNKH
jgi:hypothetical protein